jgi:hypothetical protein
MATTSGTHPDCIIVPNGIGMGNQRGLIVNVGIKTDIKTDTTIGLGTWTRNHIDVGVAVSVGIRMGINTTASSTS